MLPPAPPLFSTMTGTPSAFCNSGATIRAITSLVPPTIGTMIRTVFVGAHSCAAAGRASVKAAASARRAPRVDDFDITFSRKSDRVHRLLEAVGEMRARPFLRLHAALEENSRRAHALLRGIERRWIHALLEPGRSLPQHVPRH